MMTSHQRTMIGAFTVLNGVSYSSKQFMHGVMSSHTMKKEIQNPLLNTQFRREKMTICRQKYEAPFIIHILAFYHQSYQPALIL